MRSPSTLKGCRISSSPPINGFWIVSESWKTTSWVPPAVPMRMSLPEVGPPMTISPNPSCSRASSFRLRLSEPVVGAVFESPSTMGRVGSIGAIVRMAPALRSVSVIWMSLVCSETSSPEASTACAMVCVPPKVLTPVVPPREPLPASASTFTLPVAMTDTFCRSELATVSSSASTTRASGLNRKLMYFSPISSRAAMVRRPSVVCR